MLKQCTACQTEYAVDLPACPHCGSADSRDLTGPSYLAGPAEPAAPARASGPEAAGGRKPPARGSSG